MKRRINGLGMFIKLVEEKKESLHNHNTEESVIMDDMSLKETDFELSREKASRPTRPFCFISKQGKAGVWGDPWQATM